MLKNRLISCILAVSIAIGALPSLVLPVVAVGERPDRVKWDGWNERSVTTDVWDGISYDTSWYTGENGREVHAGTADDPYLIESAEDLAGISMLTNASDNISYGHVAPLSDLEPKEQGAVYFRSYACFYDSRLPASDPHAYYYALSPVGANSWKYRVKGDVVSYTLECELNRYVTAYYLDNPKLYAVINDAEFELPIDITALQDPAFRHYYLFKKQEDYSVQVANGADISYVECATYEWQVTEVTRFSSRYDKPSCFFTIDPKYTMNWGKDEVYITYAEGGADVHTATCSISELGIYQSDDVVVNAFGEKWYIDPTQNDIFKYISSAARGYAYNLSDVTNKVNGFPISSAVNTADNWLVSVDTSSTDSFLPEVDFDYVDGDKVAYQGGYSSGYPYSYFQDTTISTDAWYNNLGSVVYAQNMGAPLYTVTYCFEDIDYTLDKRMYVRLYEDSTLVAETSTRLLQPHLSYATGNYEWYIDDITWDIVVDEVTGTLTAKVKKCKYAFRHFFESGYFHFDDGQMVVSAGIHGADSVPLYKLDGTNAGTYDTTGRWKLISNNAKAPADFETISEAWKVEVDALSEKTALCVDRPDFKGKYFKLTTDIDLQGNALTLFPETYESKYGFAGDFDFNGRVIRNAKEYLFGTVKAGGIVHDAIVTVSPEAKMRNAAAQRTRQGFIYRNMGTVEHIEILTDNILEHATTDADFTYTDALLFYLTYQNWGVVRNIDLNIIGGTTITACTEYNAGNISDIDVLLISTPSTIELSSTSTSTCFGTGSDGYLSNIIIDADCDVLEGCFGTRMWGSAAEVYDVHIKDFYIPVYCPAPFPFAGNIHDSTAEWTLKTYVMSWPTFSLGDPASSLINCDINVEIDGFMPWSTGATNIIDTKIYIKGSTKENVNASSRGIFETGGIIKNSDITFDMDCQLSNPIINYTTSGSTYSKVLTSVYDSNIRIITGDNDITAYVSPCSVFTLGIVENSNIYVGNWHGTPNSNGFFSIGDYAKNSVFIADAISENMGAIITGYDSGYSSNPYKSVSTLYDCTVIANYVDATETRRSSWSSSINLKDSEMYVTIDESCALHQNTNYYDTIPGLSFKNIENSLVCLKNESPNVYLSGSAVTMTNIESYIKDSTFVFDGLQFEVDNHGYDRANLIAASNGNSNAVESYLSAVDNVTVFANNLKATTANGITVMNPGTPRSYSSNFKQMYVNGLNMFINFAEDSKNTMVRGLQLTTNRGRYPTTQCTNVALHSNTTNAMSHLATIDYNITQNRKTTILTNAYLDLPNAQNAIIPSSTAEGYLPGIFALGGYSYDSDNFDTCQSNWYASAAILHKLIMRTSNIYVPTGHSKVAQYYNADETTVDSWNATTRMNELHDYAFTAIHNSGMYPGYDGEIVDIIANSGIKDVDDADNAEINGELAYLLDNGGSQYRRTRSWTVSEPFKLAHPVTGEVILDNPQCLALTGMYLPERVKLEYGVNLQPVYKLTVDETEGGTVEFKALDGTAHTSGTIYVKQNTALETVETTDSDDIIFAYALQSFYDGATSRIPNQKTDAATFALGSDSDYTLNGYKLYSADTEITPVFSTARHVTVNITGDEHGTIIPSVTTTAAGEVVHLTVAVDDGYIISDLCANGNPITGMKFVMPDADVEITGTVVPFEGGITAFSLFGFAGTIDQYNHTITVTVPHVGTLNNAVPSIEYVGEYITPSTDMHVDFTSPVVYTVTYGEDSRTVDYTVTVNVSDYSMRIYEYAIGGIKGDINQATRTITVEMPYGTDVSNVVPTSLIYSAESITPAVSDAVDLRTPAIYTLNTSGMAAVNYTVTVKIAGSDIARIDEYVYAGYSAEINDEENTIILSIPEQMTVTNMIPSVLKYSGKTITPTKVAMVNPTTDPTNTTVYTVTAQSGKTRDYALIVNPLSDDTARITKFTLGGATGVIDEVNKTISVITSKSVNIVDVIPDVLTYEGKSIYPRIDTVQDFTQPVIYTVVAPNNTEVPYTVNVTQLNNEAEITEFALLGFEGVVNQERKTITVEIPYGFDISDVAPSKIVYSEGATLVPTEDMKHNFNNPVEYTVTSEDGLISNTYTVTCNVADAYDNRILLYTLDGVNGTITDIGADRGIINITIHDRVDAPDYNALAPDTIVISDGATITPAKTSVMDFLDNVPQYTVTGKFNGDRIYDVYLTIVPMDTTAKITSFSANGRQGIIDQTAGTIKITAPSSERTNFVNCVPVITWEGARLVPAEGDKVNLTAEQTYTVTAEDPRITKQYAVTVEFTDEPKDTTCIITAYSVGGYVGEVNQDAGTITIRPETAKKDKLTNVVPDYITWQGAGITPSEYDAIDLTADNTYRVVAEDSAVYKDYKLLVEWIDVPTPPTPSDDCIITAYKALGVQGIINQNTGVITLSIDKSKRAQCTNVVPDNITWRGATLTPNERASVDLTASPVYRVTAESGKYKDYTVKVSWIEPDRPTPPGPSNDCIITKYEVVGVKGEIDQTALTITLNIPLSKKGALTSVVPDKIEWRGKTLSPNERTAVTIVDGLTYKVTAESGKQKTYTIKLNWVDDRNTDCIITHYAVAGVDGVIDQNALTITLNVPLSQKDALNNVTPDRVLWKGKTLTPTEKTAVTVVDGLTYTVTAENPNIKKTYTIKLNWVDDRDDDCIITYYKALGIAGEIDQDALTITMPIPLSKKDAVENVVPDRIKWRGKTLTPAEQDAVTLADGLTYTVTAGNGKQKTYTIKIDWIDDRSDECIITYYKAADVVGAIDQSKLTITMLVPLSKQGSLENIVPDKIKWRGETLTPSESDIITLEDGLSYTVTAENGSWKTYTVKIEWIDDRDVDCIITAYKVCGIEAEIDQDALTINLEIPEARKQHCTNIAPDFVAWYGSKLVPSETNGVDLTEDLVYRVYAENTDIYKDYTVNVVWIKEPETGEPDPDDKPNDNPDTGHTGIMPALLTTVVAGIAVTVSKRKRKK